MARAIHADSAGAAGETLPSKPLISVIILNYNGAFWLERCLQSLRSQTLFSRMEIIVADNNSPDGSLDVAARVAGGWENVQLLQLGENLGYCAGNNAAAERASGTYLFFLNNDTWLEPDCLEQLLSAVEQNAAAAAMPLVLDYDTEQFQSLGALGFDLFGLPSSRLEFNSTRDVLMPEGCAYLVLREAFENVGRFDPEFFMYADEYDLSWRLWTCGYRAIAVPKSRLHHRGAAQVNPKGGGKRVEFRTSDLKRFYANRNSLLVILKNAQSWLLITGLLQVMLLLAEAVAGLLLIRRWGFVRKAYWCAFRDCWRLRHHILSERRRLRSRRRHGDLWMLRFWRLRLNRWDEMVRMRRAGLPKVTADSSKPRG